MKFPVEESASIEGVRLNHGRSLAHPLQSSYALARRLIVANPTASMAACFAFLKKSSSSEAVDSIEPYLWRNAPTDSVRQCVFCAQRLFHPSVYGLPALTLCPVHHSPFSSHCPGCGHAWERRLTRRTPQCEICGSTPWAERGTIQLKQRLYRQLKWFNDWLVNCQSNRKAHTYPELFDIYRQLRPRSNVESPRFTQPELCHPFYAAFESQKRNGVANQRLSQLHVITHSQSLCC